MAWEPWSHLTTRWRGKPYYPDQANLTRCCCWVKLTDRFSFYWGLAHHSRFGHLTPAAAAKAVQSTNDAFWNFVKMWVAGRSLHVAAAGLLISVKLLSGLRACPDSCGRISRINKKDEAGAGTAAFGRVKKKKRQVCSAEAFYAWDRARQHTSIPRAFRGRAQVLPLLCTVDSDVPAVGYFFVFLLTFFGYSRVDGIRRDQEQNLKYSCPTAGATAHVRCPSSCLDERRTVSRWCCSPRLPVWSFQQKWQFVIAWPAARCLNLQDDWVCS